MRQRRADARDKATRQGHSWPLVVIIGGMHWGKGIAAYPMARRMMRLSPPTAISHSPLWAMAALAIRTTRFRPPNQEQASDIRKPTGALLRRPTQATRSFPPVERAPPCEWTTTRARQSNRLMSRSFATQDSLQRAQSAVLDWLARRTVQYLAARTSPFAGIALAACHVAYALVYVCRPTHR